MAGFVALGAISLPSDGSATGSVWRRSTIRVRWIWPVAAVRGRASTTARRRGCLNGARRPSQNARRASRSGASAPARTTTTAVTTSPHCEVGNAHHRDLGDGGMCAEHLLDLGRRNRLAAGADHVAGTADDREIALVVERAEIAGVVPAVAQRVGGRDRDRRSSRPSGTDCASPPRRCRRAAPRRPAARRRRCPGLREEVGVAELHAGPGFGRAVEDARAGVGECVLDRAQQLGRRRRRPGVGLLEAREVVTARRRARGCATTPRECNTGATARCRSVVRNRVSASGVRTKCTGRRPCHAPSAIVQPAMWNSGNMQTVPAPPAVVVAPTYVRSQLARCDSTTPFGRPVLPLVKKMTCGSRSSSSAASGGRAAPVGISGENGTSTRAASSAPSLAVRRAAQQQPGVGRIRRRATTSSSDARAFSGANTAPILASAANTGTASSDVSPHHSTRSPRPTQRPRSPFAMRFDSLVDLAERQGIVVEGRRDRVGCDAGGIGEHLRDVEHARNIARPWSTRRLACRQPLLLVCLCHEGHRMR